MRDQVRDQGQTSLGARVDRDGPLALIEACAIETPAVVKRPAPDIYATARRIDSHHLRAEFGQGGAAERRGYERRELDHA